MTQHPWPRSLIFVSAIQQATADEYEVPLSVMVERDAMGTRERLTHAHPRQSAIYVASCLTTHSLVRLGQLFGNRDHSTIISAIQSVKRRLATDATAQEKVGVLPGRCCREGRCRVGVA
jgi:chromosomal replication initiator protein